MRESSRIRPICNGKGLKTCESDERKQALKKLEMSQPEVRQSHQNVPTSGFTDRPASLWCSHMRRRRKLSTVVDRASKNTRRLSRMRMQMYSGPSYDQGGMWRHQCQNSQTRSSMAADVNSNASRATKALVTFQFRSRRPRSNASEERPAQAMPICLR